METPEPVGEPPDIVYVVRHGERNEELRYSLRSLLHVPHRRVVIAGYKPSWVKGVLHVPVRQAGSKYANSTGNLEGACRHAEVRENFLLFNDDFFVMKPLSDGVPVLHRGRVADVEKYYARLANGAYLKGLRGTRRLLASLGHPDPLSYELHVPLPMSKTRFLEVLELGRRVPALHKRTLYGNVAGLGGRRMRDCKVVRASGAFSRDSTFLSTMPQSFLIGAVGRYIRAKFPTPSPYEGRR